MYRCGRMDCYGHSINFTICSELLSKELTWQFSFVKATHRKRYYWMSNLFVVSYTTCGTTVQGILIFWPRFKIIFWIDLKFSVCLSPPARLSLGCLFINFGAQPIDSIFWNIMMKFSTFKCSGPRMNRSDRTIFSIAAHRTPYFEKSLYKLKRNAIRYSIVIHNQK